MILGMKPCATPLPGYRTQAPDTSIDAELVLFGLWRSWGLQRRASQLNRSTQDARLTLWKLSISKNCYGIE